MQKAFKHLTPATFKIDGGTEESSSNTNWKKELANAITSSSELLKILQLEEHLQTIEESADFKCLVTASYVKKIKPGDINDPLLLQILPLKIEHDRSIQHTGSTDPVGDLNATASEGLIHKYNGRALLITTGACAIHCRYCFRRHYPYQTSSCTTSAIDAAVDYLNAASSIEEIILSGGDPLVLDNAKLQKLISRLETVPHLTTLRIHSRLPLVLPDRIDEELIQILRSTRLKVVMVIHCNHANELAKKEYEKLQQLFDAGITLLNQSVLLRGVNDNEKTLVALSKRLFACNTLPYYLHQLDQVKGAMHFAVTDSKALELRNKMEQRLPGYLVPALVREISGNKSKTAIFRI